MRGKPLGIHEHGFARGLPPVGIDLLTEVEDTEPLDGGGGVRVAAVTAAETGHLVLGTLHTSGATRTIDRIIDAFPASARDQIRAQLSTSLSAVISQCLLHTTDDKRVAAFEIMVRTDGIGAKIREGKTYQLLTDIETGGARGMRTLDSDLLALFFQGSVSEEEVFNYCQNPEAMRERMRAGAAAR
jgi:twitching motility protein PilT